MRTKKQLGIRGLTYSRFGYYSNLEGKNDLLNERLEPGGLAVLREDGLIALHLWGVEKATETGGIATVVADPVFFFRMTETLLRFMRKATGLRTRHLGSPERYGDKIHLPDGSVIDGLNQLHKDTMAERRAYLQRLKDKYLRRLVHPKFWDVKERGWNKIRPDKADGMKIRPNRRKR